MSRIERDLEGVSHLENNETQDARIEEDRDSELDLLPEFCHYRDEGCDIAQSCLQCPFPNCVEDEPWGRSRRARRTRDRAIYQASASEGQTVRELGARFNVSRSTVQRALAAGRKKHYARKQPA